MQTVGLSGNGGGPLVSISGAPVMFGSQQVGTTSGPAFVYLSNLGTGPLTITSFGPLGGTNPGDFNLTEQLPDYSGTGRAVRQLLGHDHLYADGRGTA